MKHSTIPLAQTLVSLCVLKGITHIVISPGSRNAPLTLEFSNHPKIKAYSIVDERCAAFFAMGMAQQLQKPVAVLCTSGSALLNYFPAVAEAYYSNIPLVVISADRPKYLINIGDGQTIQQEHVYGKHILFEANLKQDVSHTNTILKDKHKLSEVVEKQMQQTVQLYNEKEINKALNTAIVSKGPVHINAPFDEPLYNTTETSIVSVTNEFPSYQGNMDEEMIQEVARQWNSSTKKMILVGELFPERLTEEIVDTLGKDASVLVFTETTSNLHHPNFFNSIDKIIAPIEKNTTELEKLQPEILITFGGMIVSKKVKAFLRKYQPKQHWHIHPQVANDTFFCMEKYFKMQPKDFFTTFFKYTKEQDSSYQNYWLTVKAGRAIQHKKYLEKIDFSDLKVFEIVLAHVPKHQQLQLSNSSTIRYTQLFDVHTSLKVFCNRGTSGIDGSTATAIGASLISEQPTTLITGDLSFIYDSNALWNNYIRNDFRIIVINNNGGGIFRILPGNKNTENFDTYFETIHHHKAAQLADMYGFEYECVSDATSLQNSLKQFYTESNAPKLLEIVTPRTINDSVLIDYFGFLTKSDH